jgi:glycosyltransferase involved in cell wall biosynthesis
VPTPKISVIIPVFNSKKYLRTCLESVTAAINKYGAAELILVDNGSTDGSYEILLSDYRNIARIHQIGGVTISALRNLGARLAQGEYLSFIDSDCVIPKDYFHSAMAVFSTRKADAAGCYYSLPEAPSWIEETWDNINRRGVNTYVPYLFSGNLLIKKSVFEKVGGFNEELITGEDAELGLRLNASGFKIFATPDITAVHLGNPKTLGQFFRKHTWHGLGMFGSLKVSWKDKPLLATFTHLFFTTLGLMNVFVPWVTLSIRIAALLLLSVSVPAVAVAYRAAKRGGTYRPLRSVLLYHIYFSARVWALFKLVIYRTRGHVRPQNAYPRR